MLARFILLCFANLANYAMLITGVCLYTNEVTDFGTFLLGLLMGNSVIHAIFYTCMKVKYTISYFVVNLSYYTIVSLIW
ncbi:hypothetical protein NQ314_012742 [Rhamnusium bicolor]|uniref:Uncharacterized protein n=1 Tax=Rhamnusium bicolor TaxID=1586634 RepID=A0AAV8X9J6_9CUCU|nr:hypothetical protein NQ314_012742 [Rhamnusium bicolor]